MKRRVFKMPLKGIFEGMLGRCLGRLAPVLALPVLIAGCVQPGNPSGGNPGPGAPEQSGQRFLPTPAATVNPVPSFNDSWMGRGARDACGNPWAIELTRSDDRVSGTFWRGAIRYDVSGFLNPSGNMERVLGSKNRFYQHRIGPRLMEFNVTFGDGAARGFHYFADGRCLTPIRLAPAGK